VFTELHVDAGNVKNGWALICPFREFEAGDFLYRCGKAQGCLYGRLY